MIHLILNINIKESTKKMDDFIDLHNAKVIITKSGQKVSSSARSTAHNLIKILFKHLQEHQRSNKKPTKLKVNNVALAKPRRLHKTTAYRHIKLLVQAEVILNKVFHGRNSSYEITLNPIFLVGEKNSAYNELLLDRARYFNPALDHNTELKIKSLSPDLQYFDEFYISADMIANCNQLAIKNLIKNIKLSVNSVNNSSLQEQGKSNSTFLNNLNINL